MRIVAAMGLALMLVACGRGDPITTETTWGDEREAAPYALARLQARGLISDADVNGDGVVDIADLVIVSQNFGMLVPYGVIAPVGAVPWEDVGGFPLGHFEVENIGDGPVDMMRVRYIARDREGLLIDIDDGELVRALIPVAGQGAFYLGPGDTGRTTVWVTAVTMGELERQDAIIKLVFIPDAESLRPGSLP
ncbi:MAG: hypothetical protein GY937_22985 [bacterium]|nr:hypothetical protein [bacterium]